MAKSIFIIRSYLDPGRKSIRDISKLLVLLFSNLSKIDKSFMPPIFEGETTGSSILDISKDALVETEAELSSLILDNNKANILEYERKIDPTIDFERDHGFRILFKFSKPDNSPFSLTGSLGSSSYNYLRLEYFKNNIEFSKEWYKSVLNQFINQLNPLYAAVTPMLPDYVEMFNQLHVIHQLGWFTFFRKDYLHIDSFNANFKLEMTEVGVLIEYLNDSMANSLENYQAAREDLIEQMSVLKRQFPKYNQSSDTSLA